MMTNHYDAKMEGLNLTTIGFLEFSLLRHDIFKSIAHVWTIGLYIVEAFQDIFSANLSYSFTWKNSLNYQMTCMVGLEVC